MTTKRPLAIRQAILALALAWLLVGLGSTAALAKTTLRWKFKEGDVLRYSMDQSAVSTTQDPGGQEVKETLGVIMDMTWTVKAVDASGVATLSQKIERIRTSATSPLGKLSLDSKEAGDAASVAGPLFKMLIGAEFTSKLSPLGEMTDIKLSDKLLATLRDNEPVGAQGQFSEVGLKNMLAQMVFPLPEGNIEVGQTWSKKMAIPDGAEGKTRQMDQTFTYKGPDAAPGGPETIEFTTKFDPPKPDPNVPMTLKKESLTGRIDFDNNAGRIAKSNVIQNVEVSFTLAGKEIPRKVESTSILTLSKDKAP